ncbi:MAG: thioredoxin family protein [Bacteroidota bacterium]|jgi:thioredoxin-related protein
MKKLFTAFGLLLFTAGAFAQQAEVKWYTFEEAIELNKQEKRKIFIDVYTDWCGWCKKMEENTFTHPVIARILNEDYYAVRFDAESTEPITFQGKEFINEGTRSRSPHQLAAALLQGKMSYPSIAYMDENNQLLTAVPGYYDPKGLEPILKFFAENAYERTDFNEFKSSFDSEIQ